MQRRGNLPCKREDFSRLQCAPSCFSWPADCSGRGRATPAHRQPCALEEREDMRRNTALPIVVVWAIAILAAACSNENSGVLPTAATPVGSTATAVAPANQGTVSGIIDRTNGTMVRDAAAVAAWTAENWTFDMAADLAVEGSGPIASVTGSCPSVVLNIYGIDVEVNAATSMPIGSTCSGLAAGRVVRVRGLLYVVGGAMRVLATHVTIEGGVNTPVEGEGVVTDVSGTCPSRTLTVRGVNVVLGAGTVIRGRNNATAACSDLQVGMLLHIKAEITPVGMIIASVITILSGTLPPTNTTPGGADAAARAGPVADRPGLLQERNVPGSHL